jgi:hypothetical protein
MIVGGFVNTFSTSYGSELRLMIEGNMTVFAVC